MRGYSLMRVALLAPGLAVMASLLRKSTGLTISKFVHALERGARSALGVGTACALAGVIVGVVAKTGAGLKLASGILSISQNKLYLTMFFTMITSIILGMGVPTTANYIITLTIAAPGLLTLGVVPVAAHLFVFYFGIIADLTPPVALAAYAGAAIARSNPMKTAVASTRLAVGAFILPYIFVLHSQLLLVDATCPGVLLAVFTALLGMICLSAAVTGYLLDNLHWAFRVVLLAAGLMLLDPRVLTDGIGLAVVLGIGTLEAIMKRQKAAVR